jgi:FkbM family methyltransferase
MQAWVIRLRSLGRRMGLGGIASWPCGARSSENRFESALLGQIREGDTVWDIGAHVGFYTDLFKQRVGPHGRVVAFEPAPACFETLQKRFFGSPQVQLEEAAIGAQNEAGRLRLGKEPFSQTNRLTQAGEVDGDDGPSAEVRVIRGDSYRSATGSTPGVIKIDVEGFEEEALDGMTELLTVPEVRAIFIEVHFRLLENRGRPLAPVAIERKLRAGGFRTSWLDWSHLQALRTSC